MFTRIPIHSSPILETTELSVSEWTNTACPCKAMDEVAGINTSLIPAATFTNLVHYEMWKGSSTKGDIMKFPVYKISNTKIYANKSRWLVIFFLWSRDTTENDFQMHIGIFLGVVTYTAMMVYYFVKTFRH